VTARDVIPVHRTLMPFGALMRIDDLGPAGVGVFRGDDRGVAVDGGGRPVVAEGGERAHSRWIAESSTLEMFDLQGTSISVDGSLRQGRLGAGARENYLLITHTHLRGSIPAGGAVLGQDDEFVTVPAGHCFAFCIPLDQVECLDGNKHDVGIASAVEGLVVQWANGCDQAWSRSSRSRNPWHRETGAFGAALLEVTLAAKRRHPEPAVCESAALAERSATDKPFRTRRRSSFDFAAPSD
jgi:hypothetical protein